MASVKKKVVKKLVKGTKKAARPITKSKFDRMTPDQRRVAIAKDVIAQIDARKYVATPGTYVHFETNESWYQLCSQDGQEVLKKAGKCHVCGIGAAVCSAARVFDDCVFRDVSNLSLLDRYFSPDQRLLIESTFERWVGGDSPMYCPKIVKIDNPTRRLRAIFQNIIKNKGTFVPAKADA